MACPPGAGDHVDNVNSNVLENDDENPEIPCSEMVYDAYEALLEEITLVQQTRNGYNSDSLNQSFQFPDIHDHDALDDEIEMENSCTSSSTSNSTYKPPPNSTTKLQLQLNDTKAGMEGLDLERINKIINDSSEGSKFFEHKQKMNKKLEQKVKELQQSYEALSELAIKSAEKRVDQIAARMVAEADVTRIVIHIDMDCFFAAVETRDDPTLKDKPMAVGSLSMLSTSNYVARRYGVRAAMPGFIAKKLCPELIILPVDFEKYSAAASLAHQVYKQYDANCYCCMDEASLDITDYIISHLEDGEDYEAKIENVVNKIRSEVKVSTRGLSCSAGIASNGFLAKICSDINKPDGQFRLKQPDVGNFIKTLRIRKVCGIGEATEALLKGLGIEHCGDIYEKRGAVMLLFKPATVDFLIRVSLGLGRVFTFGDAGSDERKSFSCERTFQSTSDYEALCRICRKVCGNLSEELKSISAKGKAVCVKIKTDKFDLKTRIKSMADFTDDPEVIYRTAIVVFNSLRTEWLQSNDMLTLRLLGVSVSKLKFANGNQQEPSSSTHTSTTKSTQQTILSHLKPKSLEPNGGNCPICDKYVNSIIGLQKHVDMCLENENSCDAGIEISNTSTEEVEILEPSSSTATSTKRTREVLEANKSIDSQTKRKPVSKSPNKTKRPKLNEGKSKEKDIKMMPISFYFKQSK